MLNRTWRMLAGWIAVGALSAAGCGRGPNLVPVSGTVLVNGKPMGDLRLEFLPDPEQSTQGPRSTATTDQDGKFQLVCESRSSPGAVVGMHRVVVFDLMRYQGIPSVSKRADTPLKPSRIRPEYANSGTTPLKQDVKEDMGPVVLKLARTGEK